MKQSDFDTDSDVDFGGAMWAVVAGDCVMDAGIKASCYY